MDEGEDGMILGSDVEKGEGGQREKWRERVTME